MLQVSTFVWKTGGDTEAVDLFISCAFCSLSEVCFVLVPTGFFFKLRLCYPRLRAQLANNTNWWGNRYDLMDLALLSVVRSCSAWLGSIFTSGIICVLCRNLLIYLLTYFTEQGPSWEANRFSAGQEISLHIMESEGSSPHSQVPDTCPYPETYRSSPYPHIPIPEDPF